MKRLVSGTVINEILASNIGFSDPDLEEFTTPHFQIITKRDCLTFIRNRVVMLKNHAGDYVYCVGLSGATHKARG